MKNRILSLLLTFILIVTSLISGCSPKEESDNTSKAEREKVANVFKTNWVSIPENYSISSNSLFLSNDRIYMLGYEMPTEEEMENYESYQRRMMIISCSTDGTDIRLDEVPYQDISIFTVLSDGSSIFLLSVYDSETQTNDNRLIKTDASGNEVFSVDVSNMLPAPSDTDMRFGGSVYINSMAVDAENRIYLQSDSSVIVVSDTGEKLFDVTVPRYINQIVEVGGKVAIMYYDTDSMFKYIDADEEKIGDSVYVPENLNLGNYTVYPVTFEDDSGILYYYKTDTGLYSVNETDVQPAEILNWLNSDVSPSQVYMMTVISKDKVFYTGYDQLAEKDITAVLTKIPDDEVVPKYIIEVGYVDNGSQRELMNLAMRFNQENEDYRVKFTDYNQLSGGLYGDELTTFINSRIAVGDIPDIFLISQYSLTGKEYEDKGLFYDLYEYLDNDPEFGRDKFLKCVLPAGEVDGKLNYLISSFAVRTLVGKTENIGDMREWSVSDFLDMAESQPDGVKIIPNETRLQVFYSVLELSLSEFVNFEEGTCSFNSDLFIRLLNYLGSLPTTSDYQYDNEDPNKDYRENTALLENLNLYSFSDYTRLPIDFGTKDLTFVGYPGGGEKININSAYAVSAKSEKEIRDGAWSFIKYSFLNATLTAILRGRDGFPSTYDDFNKVAEKEMNYYYIVRPTGMSGSSQEFTQEEIDSRNGVPMRITQEDIDEVLAYLESIQISTTIDTKMSKIINEELQYFFEDAKTAEETANIIQSRVSIYLSESK